MKHIARKRFGQHFLADPGVIDAIVRAIDPRAGQPMVEIGPGLAALTQPLVERLGRLTVIELDRDLAANACARTAQLEVIESDVLKVDFASLAARLGAETATKLRVVGNLPYNISTPDPVSSARPLSPSRRRTSTSCCRKRSSTEWSPRPATSDYSRLSR